MSYTDFNVQHEPPWYGTVCPVVWEDGGGNPASYPIMQSLCYSLECTLRAATRRLKPALQTSLCKSGRSIERPMRHPRILI